MGAAKPRLRDPVRALATRERAAKVAVVVFETPTVRRHVLISGSRP